MKSAHVEGPDRSLDGRSGPFLPLRKGSIMAYAPCNTPSISDATQRVVNAHVLEVDCSAAEQKVPFDQDTWPTGHLIESRSPRAEPLVSDHFMAGFGIPFLSFREKSAVPMSRAECGRLGGQKTAASRTPEQRQKTASRGHLAASVSAVVARAPELTPDQLARLRALFAPAVSGVER